MADMVNADCVHNRRLDALCPILVLFEYTVDRFTNERHSIYDQVINLMCFVCLLAKQCTTFKWKDIISVFSVLKGSGETLTRWRGKIYHLLTACFLLNIYAKKFKVQQRLLELQWKTLGVFVIETQWMYKATYKSSQPLVCKCRKSDTLVQLWLTSVLGSHSSLKTYTGCMLNWHVVTDAACQCAWRSWHDMEQSCQTDGQTETRQMHSNYCN